MAHLIVSKRFWAAIETPTIAGIAQYHMPGAPSALFSSPTRCSFHQAPAGVDYVVLGIVKEVQHTS